MSATRVRLLAAASGSVLIILGLVPLTALAGEGNGNYLGILSSTAPSGYIPSPASYTTPATLSFQFDVTNLTNEQQSMSLGLSVDHIITYNGQDVSDGQPGVINGAVVDGHDAASTQVQDAHPTFTTLSIAPNATQTMHMSRALAAGQCGYFQVDVAKAGLESQKGLIGFAIRVLGCATVVTGPSPSPTPGGGVGGGGSSPSPSPVETSPPPVTGSPSPGGGVGGATGSASPSPTGAVLAATGSASQSEVLGLLLLAIGSLALISAFAWRRRES
ncbi:MAG TPA: hypothetical protein VF383_05180 [Candidatus Dormibacteraeota bacterium]